MFMRGTPVGKFAPRRGMSTARSQVIFVRSKLASPVGSDIHVCEVISRSGFMCRAKFADGIRLGTLRVGVIDLLLGSVRLKCDKEEAEVMSRPSTLLQPWKHLAMIAPKVWRINALLQLSEKPCADTSRFGMGSRNRPPPRDHKQPVFASTCSPMRSHGRPIVDVKAHIFAGTFEELDFVAKEHERTTELALWQRHAPDVVLQSPAATLDSVPISGIESSAVGMQKRAHQLARSPKSLRDLPGQQDWQHLVHNLIPCRMTKRKRNHVGPEQIRVCTKRSLYQPPNVVMPISLG